MTWRGFFSGYNAGWSGRYDPDTWQYAGQQTKPAPEEDPAQSAEPRPQGKGADQRSAQTDPSLEDPHCVFQLVRRHFARYTPELVERACGVPPHAVPGGSGGDHTQLRDRP